VAAPAWNSHSDPRPRQVLLASGLAALRLKPRDLLQPLGRAAVEKLETFGAVRLDALTRTPSLTLTLTLSPTLSRWSSLNPPPAPSPPHPHAHLHTRTLTRWSSPLSSGASPRSTTTTFRSSAPPQHVCPRCAADRLPTRLQTRPARLQIRLQTRRLRLPCTGPSTSPPYL
jgi:hypothetical protein